MMLSAGRPDAQDSIAPGVPAPLAQERAKRLKDIEYRLHFSIPASANTPVTGSVVIAFTLAEVAGPVVLDFAGPADSITDARTLAGAFQPQVRDEHIVIPASMLRAGANEVRLSFASSNLALNRNPEFMHTLFVPARARLAFPCFDQPDLKARFTLTLDVPEGWRAVTNAAEQARKARGTTTTIRFGETPPVSTYLFAFAAGRFQAETAERSGRQFTMLHRETDAAKVARNREAIFDLHASAIEWLERYTGIPYPFAKFDFVLIPSFQFGGMEHPGSIFYNASSLFFEDPEGFEEDILSELDVTIAEHSTQIVPPEAMTRLLCEATINCCKSSSGGRPWP